MSNTLRKHAFLLSVTVLFLAFVVVGAVFAQRRVLNAVREYGGALDIDAPASGDGRTVRFRVESGDTAADIADRLEQRGLIRSALAFRIQARSSGVGSQLAAGEYDLSQNMKPSEILRIMQQQIVESGINVTFPEGWRLEEMADRLEARGVISRTDFLRAASDGKAESALFLGRTLPTSLEGYLFPDTYTFSTHVTATAVVDTMLRNFDRRFDVSLRQQGERQGLSTTQVVTLASIVEREAVLAEERPMIAEVFLNRLSLGMPLQADPTVQYAVAEISSGRREYWKKDLTQTDLQVDSPFNTYRNRGLPPGPICNPGLAALKAAISPTSTGYLYFVAKPGGAHAFARTLDEHNENVSQFRNQKRN